MWNKVRHYVLDSCIKNRYHHLIDVKIEKSPLPVKLIHRPSYNISISFLKMSNSFLHKVGNSELLNRTGFACTILW